MKSFKQTQAKYSRRIHKAIDSVDSEQWGALRDTAIELVAAVAAVVELTVDTVSRFKVVRAAARAAHA